MDVNLIHYISYCTKIGISPEVIKKSLISAGWKESTIEEALKSQTVQPATKKSSINLKLWTGPVILSAVLLIFTNSYNFFYFGSFTTKSIVEAIAGAAAILIGISFSLSSMSYYFNFLDTKLAYRKEIGLLGYYLAVTYSVLLMITVPERYLNGFSTHILSWDFILGLSALAILTAMALVSVNKIMMKVTPAVGRKILRFGYVAYFLLIVRAIILEHDIWLSWIANYNGLPPARLLVTFFSSFVIILRIMMAIGIFTRAREKTKTPA